MARHEQNRIILVSGCFKTLLESTENMSELHRMASNSHSRPPNGKTTNPLRVRLRVHKGSH